MNFMSQDRDEKKSYSNEELSHLVFTLEKKVTQKLTYVDERFRKNEDDIIKLKLMEKGIDQINRNIENINKYIETNKDTNQIIFAKIEELHNQLKKLATTQDDNLKNEIEKLKNHFEKNLLE